MDDVTDKVTFAGPDEEALAITRCVCGAQFPPWTEIVGVEADRPWTCPQCGARLVFEATIRVLRV